MQLIAPSQLLLPAAADFQAISQTDMHVAPSDDEDLELTLPVTGVMLPSGHIRELTWFIAMVPTGSIIPSLTNVEVRIYVTPLVGTGDAQLVVSAPLSDLSNASLEDRHTFSGVIDFGAIKLDHGDRIQGFIKASGHAPMQITHGFMVKFTRS